jgi:uncharacterized protein (DUF342 family)
MGLKFSATSLSECIEKACSELGISKEMLKYNVIKEERKFFKKIIEIEVLDDDKKIDNEEKEIIKNNEENEKIDVHNNGVGAKVQDGKIIINESENKEIITIKSSPGISLYINGQICDKATQVTVNDRIEYKFDEIEPIRNADISITNDSMEAYINIRFTPKHKYELVDQEYQKNLILVKRKVSDEYLPKYTVSELNDLLKSKGIRYGIMSGELEIISNEYKVENKLVAKGLPVQDDIPDEIHVLFKESEELDYEDTSEKVDYRNRFSIANANVGDIIGEIIPGKAGCDGQNVFGEPIKRKTAKKVSVKIGEGCKIENNKIITTFEGKPTFKANTFTIHRLYKVDNVDLKSGNIDFVGNVEIAGIVSEAMEVKAGNELHVGKNVDSAILKAGGEIVINGNVLNSTVTAGSENVERRQYLDNLITMKNIINELIASVEQIKENNLLGLRQDGEVIKILIENKFKSVPKLSRSILNYNMSQGVQQSEITTFIINKLMGLGPLKIKDYKGLGHFIESLQEEIEENEELIVVPSNVYLGYAQGCTIEASGSVFITGKGQYTSDIIALNNIEFLGENAVCRGGILCAGSEIKLKTVGSIAGVKTTLKVPKKGRIMANVAYNNTIFCFGERQVVLEVSSKNVEVYVDKAGDIVIDKFVL